MNQTAKIAKVAKKMCGFSWILGVLAVQIVGGSY
jgi:hypothetical protein